MFQIFIYNSAFVFKPKTVIMSLLIFCPQLTPTFAFFFRRLCVTTILERQRDSQKWISLCQVIKSSVWEFCKLFTNGISALAPQSLKSCGLLSSPVTLLFSSFSVWISFPDPTVPERRAKAEVRDRV